MVSFTQNLALLDLVQEKQKSFRCVIHKKKLKYAFNARYHKYFCSECLKNRTFINLKSLDQQDIYNEIKRLHGKIKENDEIFKRNLQEI